MRLPLILTTAALALSGCVVQNPGMAPPPVIPQVTPAPDAAIRSSARVVVNREMARRLPGANVAPYTDCVMQNATTAELAGIADSANASGAVASIVSARPPAVGRAAAALRAGSAVATCVQTPAAQASDTPVSRMGTVTAAPGLRLLDASGQAADFSAKSFDHFG